MKNFIFAGIFFLVISAANLASAAEIDRAYYLGNPDVSYPLIVTKNPEAATKINGAIREEIKKILESANSTMAEGNFDSMVIDIDYKIPCNHDGGTLSVILTAYVNYENSAHPSNSYYGLNFNSSTGERITAENLNYTPQEITAKLQNFSQKNNRPLDPDFQGLSEVPQNFYYDDNLHVHFIFNQYEVAAYAVGIIDLDAAIN